MTISWPTQSRLRSLSSRILTFASHNASGFAGAIIVLLIVLSTVTAPVLSPYDPLKLHQEAVLAPPNARFILGTDDFGRDLLSRLLYGGRTSLYIGLSAVFFGETVGVVLGLSSGYFGGKTDMAVQRVVDTLMALPALVLALSVVAALGASSENVILAVTLVQIPRASRIMRSAVLAVKDAQYVEAARALGCSTLRIVMRHVLPQCVPPVLVLATIDLSQAIVVEASLSFLGLGVPPPNPSWGQMLAGVGRERLEQAPWIAIWPGAAISLAVLGFNLLGDGLRDWLDPRLRKL